MQLLSNTTSPFVRIARVALMEKGFAPELVSVDPWDDNDGRLRRHNVASRVPSLVLADGTAINESLVIAQWAEARGRGPSLLGNADQIDGVMARAGMAFGAIDASVITLISRKTSQPTPFDDTAIGARRRRTMVEAMQTLDAYFAQVDVATLATQTVTLDVICAVTMHDYLNFRFGTLDWMPRTPGLAALSEGMRARDAIALTVPH